MLSRAEPTQHGSNTMKKRANKRTQSMRYAALLLSGTLALLSGCATPLTHDVVQITANKALVDQAGSEQVFQMFRSRGVAQRTADYFFLPSAPPMIFVPIPIR